MRVLEREVLGNETRLLYWKIDLKLLRLGSNSYKNIWGFTDFIFSYFPPNQTILKPKTLTNISRQLDIKKNWKEKQQKNIGLPSIRSTMSNESGASFLLYSLGWRVMEEENEGERYERKGRKISGITWGHFWNISKNLRCFFYKKKTPSKWFFKNHFKCFPKFSKVFFKICQTFYFHPKNT